MRSDNNTRNTLNAAVAISRISSVELVRISN